MTILNILKKLFLFLFFGSSSLSLYSQRDSDPFFKKRNAIIFAPLNTFDIINPSFQIGYERLLHNDKFAIQAEAGLMLFHSLPHYFIDYLNEVKDCAYSNSGFKVRSELKYFYSLSKSKGPYFSLELFYLRNKSGVKETFNIVDTTFVYSEARPIGANVYDDFFYNDKQRFGLNLKIGVKLFFLKNFYFEPFIGLGLVYRTSKHYERENLNDTLYGEELSFHNKIGNMFIPNLPANIKIGYRF
jgi:hypothetical protein